MEKLVRCYHPDGTHQDFSTAVSLEDIRKNIQGWVQTIRFQKLTIMCDEEGKLKGLPVCGHLQGQTFVGDLYVGELCNIGLRPVELSKLEEFEKHFQKAAV